MRTLCFAVSAFLVTGPATLAPAQQPHILNVARPTGLALSRLKGGQWVRIRTTGGRFVEGWVSDSPNLIRVSDASTIEVPADGVESLWVRHGSHAGTGAVIGGTLVGIGLGVVANEFAHTKEGCEPQCGAGPFIGGLLIGGAGGAIIGALIGAPFPKWQRRPGSALSGLRVGQHVRIQSTGGGFIEGAISNSPTLVSLRTADGSNVGVPAPGIDSLWVHRTHATTGALMGGAFLGVGLGTFLAFHVNKGNPYNANNTAAGGLGFLIGAACGALLGELIGSASPKWELRVP